jgi:hypothetical protein
MGFLPSIEPHLQQNLSHRIACGPGWFISIEEARGLQDVSTYDPQVYGPTPLSPRDSQGSCQSAEQGDYKRLNYLYSLATQTLTMIKLEND